MFEGPTRFGRRVPGDAQVKEPNGIGPCGEEEIRTAFGAGMWGGKLPSTWEPIDAEMYAILAYLRKMASASDAQSRRCLVLCDCKPALQQIESAHRKGMPEGLRDHWERAVARAAAGRGRRGRCQQPLENTSLPKSLDIHD